MLKFTEWTCSLPIYIDAAAVQCVFCVDPISPEMRAAYGEGTEIITAKATFRVKETPEAVNAAVEKEMMIRSLRRTT